MKKIIEELIPLAKANLEKDGHIVFVILCFDKQDKLINPVLVKMPKEDSSKKEMLFGFGKFCKENDFGKIVLIMDCASRKINSMNEYRHLIENYDTERPTIYPESMRTETIVLIGIDFINGCKQLMANQEYKKEDKEIKYGECSFSENNRGVIPDSIIEGYNTPILN